MTTELIWEGKYDEYGNRRTVDIAGCAMPLQKIETIDEPASWAMVQGNLFDPVKAHRDDFRNRLIWGDNKLVMANLFKEFAKVLPSMQGTIITGTGRKKNNLIWFSLDFCIFNTHDTTVLDQTLMRRDQVWFVEKDEENSTRLYPLTDYKPRKGEALQKGYLYGRYGALPFTGEI